MGVNPRTGERVQIAATTVPKFSAGSQLKAALKRLGELHGLSSIERRGPRDDAALVVRFRRRPLSCRRMAVATLTFGDRVAAEVERKRSQLVVGLDPLPDLLPGRAPR